MATPRAAEPRDLEQRLRTMERQLANLSSRVLMQRQLEVTQGDFVVSGGGNIKIKDDAGHTVWDALSGPVAVAVANGATDSLNFPPAGTWGTFNTQTFTVPAGYTKALVFALATVGATANTSGGASWKVRPVIAGNPEPNDGIAGMVPAGAFASWACGYSLTLSGLSGPFTVAVQAAQGAGSNFQANSANGHITAVALFLR